MNESTLTQLKIIVERPVRPIRASNSRKRKMREELLAHVVGVFEEESARLGDERAALERTALRFGNPAQVTSELQETIPSRDAVRRFWEGRPGEPAWRTAIRFAWVSGVFALVIAGFLLAVGFSFEVGSVGAWPREALIQSLCAVLIVPAWLSGLVFLANFMERALYGPARRSRLRIALVVVGSWLFMLLLLAAWSWPTWSAKWSHHSAIVMACFLIVAMQTCALGHSSLLSKRYREEWARLPIEIAS